MSRTWAELLGDADDGTREAEERSGFFTRLRDSLGKSRRALVAELGASFDPAQEDAWERLEVALIRADVGVPATGEATDGRFAGTVARSGHAPASRQAACVRARSSTAARGSCLDSASRSFT